MTALVNILVPGFPSRRGIARWCNGIPGIAAGLMAAGRRLGHDGLFEWSLARAKEVANSIYKNDLPSDCSLCHGAAGLGHLFNRMYQWSFDEQLSEAAKYWFAYTLDNQNRGIGIGGYAARGFTRDGEPCDLYEPGFLRGGAGIGLALMAATGSCEPSWDRALLLS
jgi:lantibiotic biosynthesis protein